MDEKTTLTLDPETEGLRLPDGLVLIERLGKGRTSTVYKAEFQGETVALKAYKATAAEWYRKKLDKNIAIYEMMQNRAFRAVPELVPYTAKPVRVIGQDGKHTLCYLQEFIDGITLEELGERYGQIPGYLMQTGQTIARVCEEKDLRGVDQFMKDVKLRKKGTSWEPVMFDFKHVPSDKSSDARQGFLQRFGLGRKPRGPGGFLGEWEALEARLTREAS